jgi:hypothetical protein
MKTAIAAFFLLSACAGGSGRVETQNLALTGPWQKEEVDKTVYKRPLELAAARTGDFPESTEGRQMLNVSIAEDPEKSGFIQMVVTTAGQLDDAVAGRQWRILFTRVEGGWMEKSAETRWRCYAGRGTRGWTITPCS